MKINEKIKRVRQARGFSQEDVANLLDISPNSYGSIERGEVDIKVSRLQQLAELFGVHLNELLDLNQPTVLNIITDHSTQNSSAGSVNYNSDAHRCLLTHQIEKLELVIEGMTSTIESQKSEIFYLKKIIDSIIATR